MMVSTLSYGIYLASQIKQSQCIYSKQYYDKKKSTGVQVNAKCDIEVGEELTASGGLKKMLTG